jgi:hypothetical protein
LKWLQRQALQTPLSLDISRELQGELQGHNYLWIGNDLVLFRRTIKDLPAATSSALAFPQSKDCPSCDPVRKEL